MFESIPISAGQLSLDSTKDFRRCLDSLEGDKKEVKSVLPSSDPTVNAEDMLKKLFIKGRGELTHG